MCGGGGGGGTGTGGVVETNYLDLASRQHVEAESRWFLARSGYFYVFVASLQTYKMRHYCSLYVYRDGRLRQLWAFNVVLCTLVAVKFVFIHSGDRAGTPVCMLLRDRYFAFLLWVTWTTLEPRGVLEEKGSGSP